MTFYEVNIHPGFHNDLRAMADYIADAAGERVALQWSLRVLEHLEQFDVQPIGHAIVREGPPRPAYNVPYDRHRLIFYERFDDLRVVRVLYLWHTARNGRPDLERQWDELV